jgi:hypothetical protein
LNRELAVPHTVALPLNYIHLKSKKKIIKKKIFFLIYVGVIRTLIDKYQKFMTYLLVNNIFIYKKIIDFLPAKLACMKKYI